MSWSITVNDLQEIDSQKVKDAGRSIVDENPEYEHDLLLALDLAKRAGLSSATLAGVRAPNPYGNDEVVDISVRGMASARDFIPAMSEVISNGPAVNTLSVLHLSAAQRVREGPPCHHKFNKSPDNKCVIFDDCHNECLECGVHLYRGLLHFQDQYGT